jgi:hypothetical protein
MIAVAVIENEPRKRLPDLTRDRQNLLGTFRIRRINQGQFVFLFQQETIHLKDIFFKRELVQEFRDLPIVHRVILHMKFY